MDTSELEMDIASVCRICLQDSDTHMVSIYDSDEEHRGVSICEKIENCSGIKVIWLSINGIDLKENVSFPDNTHVRTANSYMSKMSRIFDACTQISTDLPAL